jgi:hypothetical protein
MNIKKQVCSLKLAKQLKELGVKQESLFYWSLDFFTHISGKKVKEESLMYKPIRQWPKDYIKKFLIPAFTCAELGEMLPEDARTEKKWKDKCYQFRGFWGGHEFWSKTEANARAKMLIYLLKNKLINN